MTKEKKDFKDQINDIVEKALTQKTFSLDVVEQIKKLKDDFSDSQIKVDELEEKVKNKVERINDVVSENEKLKEKLENYETKQEEFKVAKRQLLRQKTELRIDKAKIEGQQESKSDLFRLVETIFKNHHIRKTITENVQQPDSNNPGCSYTYKNTKDIKENKVDDGDCDNPNTI